MQLHDAITAPDSDSDLRPRPINEPSSSRWRLLIACVAAGVFGLLLALGSRAEVRDFYFKPVTGSHGLAQNTVNALLQDEKGFVWVGTQGGLNRYDGQDYRLFTQLAGDAGSLPDNLVTALANGDPGEIWVGTDSAYVARLDLASGSFQRLLPPELDHPNQPGKRVLALYYQHGYGLWITTDAGIELLDPASGRRRSVLMQTMVSEFQSTYSYASDARGMIWATTPSGLYRIDPVTLKVQRTAIPRGLQNILRDARGDLWVAADGLYRLDPATGSLDRRWPAQSNAADWLHYVTADQQGNLWLATIREGLVRYTPGSGETLRIPTSTSKTDGPPPDDLRVLMVDRSDLLWIGSEISGVTTTSPQGARFSYVSDPDPARNQRYTNSVRSLYQTDDGALWIGTDGDGLKRYDLRSDQFVSYADALKAAMPQEIMHHDLRVMAIRPADKGRLWIATNLGLYLLDPATRHVIMQRLLASETNPELQALNVRTLALAGDGGLWIGTRTDGVFKIDSDGVPTMHLGAATATLAGVSSPMINSLYEDTRGSVWIGTMDGLDRLQIASGRVQHFLSDAHDPTTLSGNRVRVIVPGKDGSIWVGTHSGLNRLRASANGDVAIERYLPASTQSQISTTIYGVLEDTSGNLWLSTNNGLQRLDPDRRTFRHFGDNDGLQHTEFNGGAQLRLNDGRLVFGGIRGLNLFDPARLAESHYAPNVVLTSARVGSAPDNLAGLMTPARLEFKQEQSVVRLHFAAMAFADPEAISYRYRLDGFDHDWIDAGHTRDATYTNLDAGEYVFRAQATNRDGVWSANQLILPLSVVPPWWASRYAWLLYALIGLLLALLVVRALHNRRLRERTHTDELRRREEHLKMALWGSGDDFWDLDVAAQTLRRLNAQTISEHPQGNQISVSHWRNSVIHPDDLVDVEQRMREHILGRTAHFESEHRIHTAEGVWTKVLARGKVVERDAVGHATRVAGTARDITQMDHAERERRIAGEVLNAMAEAVTVVDLDFRFVSVNNAFSTISGYAEEEVIGLSSALLDSSQHPPQFYEQMRAVLEQTGHWAGEMWQRRKDGEEFLCAIEVVEVGEPGGKRVYFVAVLSDITERKRAEQELRYLANFDTLTGLPNRALLSERLARAIVRARRQDTLVAVLFLDLDRFKEINDSLGHSAGDRILKAVAARLQGIAGPADTVSRLGGDEFTLVIEDLTSAEGAFEVARRLLAAFAQPLVIDDRSEISITPSVGISLYPAHGLAPTDLLKHADSAMYQAKANGRNTYLVYTEAMETESRRRANLTAALRRALDRNEFQLLYQPRLSLTRGRITGVEALLRWHSEELGEVMPAAFIPIAEETGMILRIGEWVMREACRTLAQWQANGLTEISVAINVSVLQLLRGNLPQLLNEVLATTGAPANRLELELTESMVMANAAETRSMLNQIRQLGVSLAIDDFGTGYSSLVYLKQLPIDTLKIDKEFIDDLTRDPDDEAITTTIINMAHSLGLNVIAEGVESQDQLDFLRKHGCDEIQGYWLSPPLGDAHCQAFIKSWQHTRREPTPAASPVN